MAVPKLVKYGQPFADKTCESENVPYLNENRYSVKNYIENLLSNSIANRFRAAFEFVFR